MGKDSFWGKIDEAPTDVVPLFEHVEVDDGEKQSTHKCLGQESFSYPKSLSQGGKGWCEESSDFSRLLLIIMRHSDLEFLVSRERGEPHFHCCMGGFDLTLEYVAVLTMLPIYGEKNAMGGILGEIILGSWNT